jgi:hypothetical protein
MVVFLSFILAALLGALLLSAALVVWLCELAVPLLFALVIVGVAWCVVATIIYSCSLRALLERLRRRLDVVYKVSAAFDLVYRRVLALFERFFKGV